MAKANKNGKKFYFQVVKSKRLMEASLEEMELSVRAHNALRRAGIKTVGQLVTAMENMGSENNLPKLGRNLGSGSAHEIMQALWDFNLFCMSKEQLVEYLNETLGETAQAALKAEADWINNDAANEWCKGWLADVKKEADEKKAEQKTKLLA